MTAVLLRNRELGLTWPVFNSWDLDIFMLFSNVHNYKKVDNGSLIPNYLVLLTWNCFHFIFYPLILAITWTLSYNSCPIKEQRTSSSLVLNLPQTLRKTSIHNDFIIWNNFRIWSLQWLTRFDQGFSQEIFFQNIYNSMLRHSFYMNKPGEKYRQGICGSPKNVTEVIRAWIWRWVVFDSCLQENKCIEICDTNFQNKEISRVIQACLTVYWVRPSNWYILM